MIWWLFRDRTCHSRTRASMSVKLIIRAYLHYIVRSERLKLSKTKIGEERNCTHPSVGFACVRLQLQFQTTRTTIQSGKFLSTLPRLAVSTYLFSILSALWTKCINWTHSMELPSASTCFFLEAACQIVMTFSTWMYVEFYVNQINWSPYAGIISPPTQVQCLVTTNV
jgi:hypothetical protein